VKKSSYTLAKILNLPSIKTDGEVDGQLMG